MRRRVCRGGRNWSYNSPNSVPSWSKRWVWNNLLHFCDKASYAITPTWPARFCVLFWFWAKPKQNFFWFCNGILTCQNKKFLFWQNQNKIVQVRRLPSLNVLNARFVVWLASRNLMNALCSLKDSLHWGNEAFVRLRSRRFRHFTMHSVRTVPCRPSSAHSPRSTVRSDCRTSTHNVLHDCDRRLKGESDGFSMNPYLQLPISSGQICVSSGKRSKCTRHLARAESLCVHFITIALYKLLFRRVNSLRNAQSPPHTHLCE